MRFFYALWLIVLLTSCTSNVISASSVQENIFQKCTTEANSPVNGSMKIEGKIVANIKEFDRAISQAKPGDTIVLKNGTWSNCEMLIDVSGRKLQNITVTAETKGKVIFSGQSWFLTSNTAHGHFLSRCQSVGVNNTDSRRSC